MEKARGGGGKAANGGGRGEVMVQLAQLSSL